MNYAVPADMLALFGEREMLALADRYNDGVPDDAVTITALDAATAEINGYLTRRYVLPLIVSVPVLRTIACEIARYRLTGAGTTETQPVRERYRDAVRWLERAGNGEVILVDGEGNSVGAPHQSGMGGVKTHPGRRAFDDQLLSDYRFGR